jgi:signal transduction histidine kinase
VEDRFANGAAPPRDTRPADRAARANVDRDLDDVLRDVVQQLVRRSGGAAVSIWRRAEDGDAVALDGRLESRVPESRDLYTELAHLSRPTDLGAGELQSTLERVISEFGFSAAAPIAAGAGEAPAVLLLGGPKDPAGRVRPQTLGALANAARRLELPLAASASFARLRRLDADIRELDRRAALGQLLAEVVHEIRNPLVSVKTFLQLLPDRAEDPEFRTKFASVVEDELRRVERLLDAALVQARPTAATTAAAGVVVAPILESVALLVSHRATERQVRLEVDAAARLPGVTLSEDALRQVILNLSLNAIDATEAGGLVRLRAQRAHEGVEIVVEDQGRGIPEALRDRVFEPFFSTKSDRPGGLGLAISRRIVEQAGGRIAISDRAGGGSAFRLRLPIRAA